MIIKVFVCEKLLDLCLAHGKCPLVVIKLGEWVQVNSGGVEVAASFLLLSSIVNSNYNCTHC